MRTTRRSFLAAQAFGLCAAQTAASAKSRVAIGQDPELRTAGAGVDSARLAKLLDRVVQAVYNRDNAMEAWKLVVRPNEVVGLKVNCLAGRGASTSPALVEAVVERLRQAGAAERNIVIWDRLNDDLESGGFRIATAAGKLRCFGNDAAGYEDELSSQGSAASRLSKTITRTCDAVISLPALKDHGIAGVTMALKNMFGAIHNPNKYHGNAGDPYVADVYMLVRRKVRLTICDAIEPQYEGGPSTMPQWTWRFNGLLAATDPVALDAVGWRIIERQRAAKGMKTLEQEKRQPRYIATAADAAHRLGVDDPARIERREV